MERTLAIIKPDGVARHLTGEVLSLIEKNGFTLVGLKMIRLTPVAAGRFYEIHKEKPFYGELLNFMTEGPVIVAVLEKEHAVEAWRTLMGATNPQQAAEGTIRRLFAENVSRNVVHGSDSRENARREIDFFFSENELAATEK